MVCFWVFSLGACAPDSLENFFFFYLVFSFPFFVDGQKESKLIPGTLISRGTNSPKAWTTSKDATTLKQQRIHNKPSGISPADTFRPCSGADAQHAVAEPVSAE